MAVLGFCAKEVKAKYATVTMDSSVITEILLKGDEVPKWPHEVRKALLRIHLRFDPLIRDKHGPENKNTFPKQKITLMSDPENENTFPKQKNILMSEQRPRNKNRMLRAL